VSRAGRLVFPAIRWSPTDGFNGAAADIQDALDAGVGGFCLFGGTALAVRELTASLRDRSDAPLLIGSDLERGAGQQFTGCTQLPPLAALGALDDVAITRAAAALTAREALAVGVNWILAPVADVDLEPLNPIVGSRAFSGDPTNVAMHVVAWIMGAREAGALCCAKHFPGHGRTTADSHAALPRVGSGRDELEADLLPFRAAVHAQADALMTAHVVYDALDPATAATLSARVIHDLARRDMGYDGLVVTDALNMTGVLEAVGGGEAEAAVAALKAGCDALLYPEDVPAVVAALTDAAHETPVRLRMQDALRRVDAAAARAPRRAVGDYGTAADREWADALALRCMAPVRGEPAIAGPCALLTIDDDVGGPYAPPSRAEFAAALRAAGVDAVEADAPGTGRPLVVAVYADIRAWKPAPGLSPAAARRLAAVLDAEPDAAVVFFGPGRLTTDVAAANLVCAWGGEALMQRAAARWLAGER
jgi:beta-glucosidase-like glycosyl hydrolase